MIQVVLFIHSLESMRSRIDSIHIPLGGFIATITHRTLKYVQLIRKIIRTRSQGRLENIIQLVGQHGLLYLPGFCNSKQAVLFQACSRLDISLQITDNLNRWVRRITPPPSTWSRTESQFGYYVGRCRSSCFFDLAAF